MLRGRDSRPCVLLIAATMGLTSCKSPGEYRSEADDVAKGIVHQKQIEALGRTEPFTIATPEQTLRQRLLLEQALPVSGPASLGPRALPQIDHWPDDDYLTAEPDVGQLPPPPTIEIDAEPVQLSLEEALRVAAANSRAYQIQKERVYLAALDLDLERDVFRNTFTGLLEGFVSADLQEGEDAIGVGGSASGGIVRRFRNGATITSLIAVDLVKLLTLDRSSSLGLSYDASIEIPLLRGAGRWLVAEPLTQAERDAVYAIYEFERFKGTFAVEVASQYLDVLRQLDEVDNAEANYRGLVIAVRRARALAEAGQLSPVQVDQAVQDELRARNRWIAARARYGRELDRFKILLGLPTDALVVLDRRVLEQLAEAVAPVMERIAAQEPPPSEQVPPADAPVKLMEPDPAVGGPLELGEEIALRLALDNRLDLRVAQGEVYDAQRQVAIAANGFLPDLTLLGTASVGSRRGIGSAGADDAELRFDRGRYDALLQLDLPFERTVERNLYRLSLIDLERIVRDVQELEDQIKLAIRDGLRRLMESRETLRIQAQAAALAERRVASTNLFLEAGRAEIRDLLEAQEALVSAQNALTSALVSYRVAELELQSDLGVLEVGPSGLWREFDPDAAVESMEGAGE